MTFTLRQVLLGLVIHLGLRPAALAVMPPYSAPSDTQARSQEQSATNPKDASNQEMMQALLENQRLLRELLKRCDPVKQVATRPSLSRSQGD